MLIFIVLCFVMGCDGSYFKQVISVVFITLSFQR